MVIGVGGSTAMGFAFLGNTGPTPIEPLGLPVLLHRKASKVRSPSNAFFR